MNIWSTSTFVSDWSLPLQEAASIFGDCEQLIDLYESVKQDAEVALARVGGFL